MYWRGETFESHALNSSCHRIKIFVYFNYKKDLRISFMVNIFPNKLNLPLKPSYFSHSSKFYALVGVYQRIGSIKLQVDSQPMFKFIFLFDQILLRGQILKTSTLLLYNHFRDLWFLFETEKHNPQPKDQSNYSKCLIF